MGAMFSNQFNHTIDAKGRLIIPTMYREMLGEQFMVTRGTDSCLFVYTLEDWTTFAEKLAALSLVDDDAQDFARHFLAGAARMELDKQGRILLTPSQREYAQLDKDVVLAGVGGRIEIWDKSTWDQKNAQVDIKSVMRRMKDRGFTI